MLISKELTASYLPCENIGSIEVLQASICKNIFNKFSRNF